MIIYINDNFYDEIYFIKFIFSTIKELCMKGINFSFFILISLTSIMSSGLIMTKNITRIIEKIRGSNIQNLFELTKYKLPLSHSHKNLIGLKKVNLLDGLEKDVAFIKALKTRIADQIHGDWQKGSKAREVFSKLKPVKDESGNLLKFANRKELDEYLKDKNIPEDLWKHYKLEADGSVNEDIVNISNRYLIGANNKAENDASADVAVELIVEYMKRGGKLEGNELEKFIFHGSDIIHQKWMVRAYDSRDPALTSESYPPDKLMKDFRSLAPVEAKKDIDMMERALKEFQGYQKQYHEDMLKQAQKNLDEASKATVKDKLWNERREDFIDTLEKQTIPQLNNILQKIKNMENKANSPEVNLNRVSPQVQ